jgi:hypothetical protein
LPLNTLGIRQDRRAGKRAGSSLAVAKQEEEQEQICLRMMNRILAILGVSAMAYYGVTGLRMFLTREGDPWAGWKAIAWIAFCAVLAMGMWVPSMWERLGDILLAPLVRLMDRWTRPERERIEREIEEVKNQVFALPVEEARRLALTILADPDKSSCEEAMSAEDWRLEPLAPLIRELFARYQNFDVPAGDFSRDLIKACEAAPGLITIGSDAFGHDEIAVKPGEETIYEVSLEQAPEENLRNLGEASYPTIYHYILFHDRLINKARANEQ